MTLLNYKLFDPPFRLDFAEMSPGQAGRYFDWFIEHKSLRIEELRRLVSREKQGQDPLDYSRASLAALGAWFDTQIRTRPLRPDELARDRADAPAWLHEYLPTATFTPRTLSICMDAAIYIAEVMRRHHPMLRWDFIRAPKSSADLHQPVLVPFLNSHLNPFRIMIVIAGKVNGGKSAATELPETFAVWEELVLPQDRPTRRKPHPSRSN